MKLLAIKYYRIIITACGYILYIIIFPFVHQFTGESTPALSMVSVAIAAWFIGIRGGILVSILVGLTNFLLFRMVKNPIAYAILPQLLGIFILIFVSTIIGWIRNLLSKVKEQADELIRERGILQEEIKKRQEAEERLSYEALHDPLTKLPNRRLFADRLEHAIEWSRRHSSDLFAVLYLDLDRFKIINDSLGHNIGDEVLKVTAQRIKSSIRAVDLAARMGGDEFAVLLEGVTNGNVIMEIVKRIQKNLNASIEVEDNSVIITASIGIVTDISSYSRIDDIIHDSDIAMYNTKISGKNSYRIFNAAMSEQAENVLELENGIRKALEKKEFRLHYQPIVSLETGQLSGFEALIRWEHPERGLLYPADFLKSAEESDLIVQIGQWVLAEACRQMQEWQSAYGNDSPMMISVNLSERQFATAGVANRIKEVLDRTGLPSKNLLVEMTEMTLIEDIESAVAKIEEIRSLGVSIGIDDFGTGYSSLGYLTHLPVNILKIDRSFVTGLGRDKNALPIIRAILSMAESLNMNVIAEGIEDEDQLNILKELGCDYGQGFFLGKPSESNTAGELVRKADQKKHRSLSF